MLKAIRSKLASWPVMVFFYNKFLATRAVLFNADLTYIAARPTFLGDGFATTRHVEFLNDSKLQNAFDASTKDSVPDEIGLPIKEQIGWRMHICTWAAQRALKLPEGDFVECGVWYGFISRAICEYVSFENSEREFYLIDPWGGLSNYSTDIYDVASKRFSKYKNVTMIRGLIPEVLPQVTTPKIAYLSIDMNGAEAEKYALEYFYNKMVPGGVIYFDDYGWEYPELRVLVNTFFADKPETLLHFPCGVSIAIKI